MTARITIPSSDVWGYCQSNKSALSSSMHEIASNFDYGISVYVTTTEDGNFGIVVTSEDDEIYSESLLNPSGCKEIVNYVYDTYLTGKVVDLLTNEEEYTEAEIQDQIDERELELDDAVYSLLDVVFDNGYINFDDIIEDVKEHILEYIARKHNIPIRRPMYLQDEDGTDFYEEYPYEHMIFDDEGNPIYNQAAKK